MEWLGRYLLELTSIDINRGAFTIAFFFFLWFVIWGILYYLQRSFTQWNF